MNPRFLAALAAAMGDTRALAPFDCSIGGLFPFLGRTATHRFRNRRRAAKRALKAQRTALR